ncbi:MAG: 4-(cytidine 5'-diphospho)-2-C-methyl-D-erythritol kinase [Candidatus Glassbacteria bacterium]
MERIVITAAGKVNIFLRVLTGEINGYHHVETLYQSVDLRDRIEIRRGSDSLTLATSGIETPEGGLNLALRAAHRYLEAVRLDEKVHIQLDKRIPVSAGLGGGSADAAAVLLGMNVLFEEKLNEAELVCLAGSLGCDVPFLLKGGTAIGWARGDRLITLSPLPAWPVLICLPGFRGDTGFAYQRLDEEERERKFDAFRYEPADFYSLDTLKDLVVNDFEGVIGRGHPSFLEIKDTFLQYGGKFALLTGTGSAIFAPFASERERAGCLKVFNERFDYQMLSTRFTAEGIQVEELE